LTYWVTRAKNINISVINIFGSLGGGVNAVTQKAEDPRSVPGWYTQKFSL